MKVGKGQVAGFFFLKDVGEVIKTLRKLQDQHFSLILLSPTLTDTH